ncbi:MAG: alpha/beta hydrolase [Chitinophagaceae bacterium]
MLQVPLIPGKEYYTHETAPTSFIEVGGTDYAYRSFGRSRGLPIVFLQHFGGTMDGWDPEITNALARNHPIILFDNKGVSSSFGKTPNNISEMANDAIDFFTAMGIGEMYLLGFSMGGFVAQYITEKRPDLVRKLILAGTGPRGGTGISNLDAVMAEAFRLEPAEPRVFTFFEKSAGGKKAARDFLERLKRRTVETDPPVSPETYNAQAKAIVAFGRESDVAYNQLKRIKQPVLIFNGNNDLMVPSVNSLVLVQQLPDAKLVMWSDSGHGGIFQYHQDFVNEVERFLSC